LSLGEHYYHMLHFENAEFFFKEGIKNTIRSDKDSTRYFLHEALRNVLMIQGKYDDALKEQDWIIREYNWKNLGSLSSNVYGKLHKHVRKVIKVAKDRNLNPQELYFGDFRDNLAIELKSTPEFECFSSQHMNSRKRR